LHLERSVRKRAIIGAVFAMGILPLCHSATASAARPCDSAVLGDGSVVRVATLRTSCVHGRTVARAFFEALGRGAGFDGKTKDGSIFYAVEGFRCFPGLGGTETWCKRHRRNWVFASTRPEDHPAGWSPMGAEQMASKRSFSAPTRMATPSTT
jgi:hypothetical protein